MDSLKELPKQLQMQQEIIAFLEVSFLKLEHPELQIRGGLEDNSRIFFLFLNINLRCDLSLEPSQPDSSNDG